MGEASRKELWVSEEWVGGLGRGHEGTAEKRGRTGWERGRAGESERSWCNATRAGASAEWKPVSVVVGGVRLSVTSPFLASAGIRDFPPRGRAQTQHAQYFYF